MKGKLLFLVIILAFLLRFVDLGNTPAGFTPDEASFGYDAYSILQTGKDQWGNVLPVSFKSFGDYKLPLYGYLAIPFVAVLGLTEAAIRIPNALLGTLAVLVTYLLVAEFSNKKTALLAALLLAISPWHIPMSRGAFEANLTTFLMPLGILLFLKGFQKPKLLILSALIFGLNVFSYHSARLVAPLIAFYLIWQYRSKLDFKNLYTRISTGVLLVFFAVALTAMIGTGGARAATSGIYNPTGGWGGVGDARYNSVLLGVPPPVARVFNNKITYITSTFSKNYVSYFSPQFLFSEGPREGTYGMIPGIGALYWIEFVFLSVLVVGIVRKKIKVPLWLCAWIILAPIPAALAKGPGHAANRAVIMLPAMQILTAFGAVHLIELVNISKRKLAISVIGVVYVFSLTFFLEDYLVQQKISQSQAMLYGNRELFGYLQSIENEYSEIIVSKSISEAHIYRAFYARVSPSVVQKESSNWDYEKYDVEWVDQIPEYKLGKYIFKSIDLIADVNRPNVLLVGAPRDFKEDTPVLKIIDYPNGDDAYWVVDPLTDAFALK